MSEIDLSSLTRWLAQTRIPMTPPLTATKFAVGQSNPTYLVQGLTGTAVLRAKPKGVLLKSAHAIDREYRVQHALRRTDVPVPRMYAYCDDVTVIGSPFYMMEHIEGRGFDDPRLVDVKQEERVKYFREMLRVLKVIHEVNLGAVGLQDFGPKGNYFRRQIDRWSGQYAATRTEPLPDMERLIAALDTACPPDDGQVTLVHGDYRLDNLLFDAQAPRVAAVLDWELSTIGHPFADLAAVIMQWQMPPGDQGRGLHGVDRAAHGLMSDAEFIALYCELRGLPEIEHFGFYVAFCFFRMAAILQGVKRRALDGNASNPDRAMQLGALVPQYAEAGLEALG